MVARDSIRRSHPECWLLGRRLGESLMRDLLAAGHRGPGHRDVVGEWVHMSLVPSLRSVPGLIDDQAGKSIVGQAMVRAALDVAHGRGERTRALVLLLDICGACHHVLGYEPELMLQGTGRAARVELVAA